MKIARFEFSLFGINTYVVYDPESRQCAIIDPGMMGIEEENAMKNFIARENLSVTHLINTHLHIDHAVGDRFVTQLYHTPLMAHRADQSLGKHILDQAEAFGIKEKVSIPEISVYLEEGDIISIGKGELQVIHTPGHSQGGICLFCKADGFIISGDTLFAGSVGRYDLPGGNGLQLIRSVKEKLITLPESTVVYPGHGPSTTIGHEKMSNPFLQ